MGKDQELLEAARKGNTAIVEKILGQRAKRSGPLASLRRGPGANVQDNSGYSALHHAALNGHKEIVRLLLEHDASTNIIDNKGSSPLHLAAWSGNVDIVRLVLSGPSICNVNLTTKDDETALHCAAQYGHTSVVSLLLEHNCDPGIRNCRGETALDLAAQYGRLDTVELLVRTDPSLINCLKRAAPDIVYPHTPLHLASRNGHKAVVEVLLKAGFNVNMRTKAGTALHEAALCGKVEVVRTLLEHGVNSSIRDSNNYTVMDLLSQFNTAQASQEIMGILKRHKRGLTIIDSDGESISHPFPTISYTDSDIGSPYENVRPLSKNARSCTTDPSPGTSPQRWDFQRHARPPEQFDDRRVSRVSGLSFMSKHITPSIQDLTKKHFFPGLLKESDNSLYQLPCAPKAFMDSHLHSEDINYLYTSAITATSSSFNREADQISLSSTASSSGYSRRPDSGGTPLYIPMNNVRGGHSPNSNSKVSPTPPKKPPRRNLSVSPTHLQPMSMSVDGVSNHAYEYLFLAHSGTKSQSNLSDLDHENRRERLSHGRSVDQYVEMNVFNIALDDDDDDDDGGGDNGEKKRPIIKELQRGKSEDLDSRKRIEPVAITSMYENMIIRQQNPRRKLRRNQDVYEEYDFKNPEPCSSAPEPTFVTSAFIMVTGDDNSNNSNNSIKNYPLSPTNYKQPPTPDHPPPSAVQAESLIFEKIRPLSQEYKRQSRDMETETEEEFLLICDESSGSISSSVSLSDRSSVDNIIEECHSDAPFAGLIKGSSRVLENLNSNTPAERPKSLKKLKRVYDYHDIMKNDTEKSSSSECDNNKENKERVSALSPFDEQEEWAKIQEIMASFGTGIVRESVFVAELEKEFQSRLMTLNCSQNSLDIVDSNTVDKWLQSLSMGDYFSLFLTNGFDDVDFLNGVLDENDLKNIGISSELDRQIILDALKQLPAKINELPINKNNEKISVDYWLKLIHLEQYLDTFKKHLYLDMERIKRIWDVELSAVLDIEKIGHRKRILASVCNGDQIITGPKLEEIHSDSSLIKSNQLNKEDLHSPSIQSSNSNNTGTIRHRHKKSRPAPPPPIKSKNDTEKKDCSIEIFVGENNSIKSQWRHQPILLITGSVNYSANYLGSTNIIEFKGIESTKKSLQKVIKNKDFTTSEEITLSISYRGVKFFNPLTKTNICEHEIRNINCACQDFENHCYFAYITKDSDSFYCQVFHTVNAEQTTDIILTLGQAFELAYQMAMREQVTSRTKGGREIYQQNKPASSPGTISSHSREFKDDPKLNGHPLKMKSLTLSIASTPSSICDDGPNGLENDEKTKIFEIDNHNNNNNNNNNNNQKTPTKSLDLNDANL